MAFLSKLFIQDYSEEDVEQRNNFSAIGEVLFAHCGTLPRLAVDRNEGHEFALK